MPIEDAQVDPEALAQRRQLGLDLERRRDGAGGVVVVPDRDVEERHHGIADVLVDEGAVLHQRVGRAAQEGVDHFVGPLRAELVGQLGEADEIGEEHGQVDEPPLFGVGIAAVAEVRVAGAALDAEEGERARPADRPAPCRKPGTAARGSAARQPLRSG